MFRPRSIGLLLAFLTLLVYLPVTSNQFTNFDDPDYVVLNPFVNQGLSWTGFKWAFADAHAANWHPLTWLSHMLDCDIFRLNPAGHHLVNALFHSANAALVFALLFRLTQKLWPSAFVAALFAWHPLHVESVAWIAERKDVLSTFFALLTLMSYTSYAQKKAGDPSAGSRSFIFDYVLAVLFFALALLSKAMPVTLPVVMLLLDFWPLKRWSFDVRQLKTAGWLLAEKIPFFVLTLAVCVITIFAQHHAESSLANIPMSLRLENVVTAYAGYLGKMIWPVDLAVFYPYPSYIALVWLLESAVFLAGISLLAWLERKNNPCLLVGWLWFLVTLLPVIGILQVGGQALADRYSYFPLIGIFLAISFSLSALAEHFAFLKKWLVVAAVFVLVLLMSFTERQISYWYDNETLFQHAAEAADSDVAHLNLGLELQRRNQRSAALTEYAIAWRMNPKSVLVNANIAGILAEENKPEQATIYYERVIKENNWLPYAFQNYGRVLVTLKRYDEAMKQFATAAKIDPTKAMPHFLMGKLWLQEGQDAKAVKELLTALKLEPGNLEMMILTASILAASEDPAARDQTQAYAIASETVKLTNRRSPAALDVLAMSYAEQGKFDDAIQTQQEAIKLAGENGMKDDVGLLQKRLEFYRKHQPWRESSKAPE